MTTDPLERLDVEFWRTSNGRVVRVQGVREDLDVVSGLLVGSGVFGGYGPPEHEEETT